MTFNCSSGSDISLIASSTARPVTSPVPNLPAIPAKAVFLPITLLTWFRNVLSFINSLNSSFASFSIYLSAASLLSSLAICSALAFICFLTKFLPTRPLNPPAIVPFGPPTEPKKPPAIEVTSASPIIPIPCPAINGIYSVRTAPKPLSTAARNESVSFTPRVPIAASDFSIDSTPLLIRSSESKNLPASTLVPPKIPPAWSLYVPIPRNKSLPSPSFSCLGCKIGSTGEGIVGSISLTIAASICSGVMPSSNSTMPTPSILTGWVIVFNSLLVYNHFL